MQQKMSPQSTAEKAPEVTLFYDGACPLCRREADHYRKIVGNASIGFVDIATPEFDAKAYGLDAKAVHKTIHARTAAGEVYTGIDAFALIWKRLPRYGWLAKLTQTPGVRQIMQVGYAAFAKVRPRLPGRSCPSGSCVTPKSA